MKWIIVIFVYGNISNNDMTIEGHTTYDTKIECNQARLNPSLKEVVAGYLRLKYVSTVDHKCVGVHVDEGVKA